MSEREPRTDDCPHCGKSNWGLWKLSVAITLTESFYGTPVEVTMPTQRPGYFDVCRACGFVECSCVRSP